MPNKKARAAADVRVSTAEQAQEGLSLPEQRRRVDAFSADQGWELVDVYEDAGISGKREDRPALVQLMSDLGPLDKLVIVKLDRFGRSARHTLELFERLVAAEVELVSLNESGKAGSITADPPTAMSNELAASPPSHNRPRSSGAYSRSSCPDARRRR